MIDGNDRVWWTTEDMAGPWFPFFDDNLETGDTVMRSLNATVQTLGIKVQPADG